MLRKSDQALKSWDIENTQLLAAGHGAKASSKFKSQFLAYTSYEMRTLISGVMDMSEILLDTHLDDKH